MDILVETDGNILLWIQNNLRNDFLDPIMKFITKLGDFGLIWIALGIFMLFFASTRRVGLTVALSMISDIVLLNLILKNLFERVRPYEAIEGLTRIIPAESSFSFPSGHAGHAFATSVVMLIMLPKKYGIPAFIFACIMAFSRLYVGVHYPTDVLAGCMVGTITALLSVKIMKKDKEKVL